MMDAIYTGSDSANGPHVASLVFAYSIIVWALHITGLENLFASIDHAFLVPFMHLTAGVGAALAIYLRLKSINKGKTDIDSEN